jgi:hypothetical protein
VTPGRETKGKDKENAMQTTSRLRALLALGGALALAACGGSPEISPAAATTTFTGGDDAAVTASGNGPGGPPSPAPGDGTCTHECDGTGPGPGAGPGPGDGLCGAACTGPVGPDPADIARVLGEALQEEYRAEGLYRSVLEGFPGAMPFAAIVQSEMQHVEALQLLFTRRQIAPPASVWTPEMFDAYPSLPAACVAGVEAETADADFYTPYLSRTDLPPDVRNVFTNLQAASLESHLPAFERCAN